MLEERRYQIYALVAAILIGLTGMAYLRWGSIFGAFLVLGIIRGMVYGVIALGIVLIYKGSRTLNFAQPFFGLFAVFIAWYLTGDTQGTIEIPGIDTGPWFIRWLRYPTLLFLFDLGSKPRFILAAIFALILIMRVGHRVEHDLMRRLQNAPRIITLVATIAISQGLLGGVLLLFERTEEQSSQLKQLPTLLPESLRFAVGPLPVSAADVQILLVVPLLVVAAAAFFKYTKFGVAIRATAENREAAQLLGVSANRVTAFTWIAAAGLAGVGALLIVPSQGSLDSGSLGIGILIRALAAALLGGLTSLPGALWGGLAVGVTEFMLRWQTGGTPGVAETGFLTMVIVALAVRFFLGRRDLGEAQVAFVPSIRELPAKLRRHSVSSRFRWTAVAVGVMLASATSLATGPFTNGILIDVLVFGIAGISLTVLIGYAGQISLGHWALVGVGAFAAGNLYDFGPVPFVLMVPLVVLIGMAVSLVLGLSALWIRGPYLAVVTLAFAVASSQWIFSTDWLARGTAGITVTAPDWGWLDLGSGSNRPLFFFGLAMFMLCAWVAYNFKNSRTGRGFFSLRENEKAAETFGISLTRYRLLAFTVSGGMASLAGVVFGLRAGQVASIDFPALTSLLLVAMVIIGGLGSLTGALLGAFLMFGAPPLLQSALGQAGWVPFFVTIASGLALIIVIVRVRGGLAGLLLAPRDPVVQGLIYQEQDAARGAPPPESVRPSETSALLDEDTRAFDTEGFGSVPDPDEHPDVEPVSTGGSRRSRSRT